MTFAHPQAVIDTCLGVLVFAGILVVAGGCVQPGDDSTHMQRLEAWMRQAGLDPENWDDRKAAMGWSRAGRRVRRSERISLALALSGAVGILAAFAILATTANDKAAKDASVGVTVSRSV